MESAESHVIFPNITERKAMIFMHHFTEAHFISQTLMCKCVQFGNQSLVLAMPH